MINCLFHRFYQNFIYGIGLTEDNPLVDDEKNWLGTNLLGKALDEVREKII